MNIAKLYRKRFKPSMQIRKNSIWDMLCKNYFSNYISSNDVCLEIASGYGEFINNINAKQKIAIDLNKDSKKYLKEDIKFINKNILDLTVRDINGKVDVIFISNFLEHLPDKNTLEILLVKLKGFLKPNGRLLIMGPNLKYLPGAYWDFYDHHLGLTDLSLIEVLENFDYKILTHINKFLPYTVNSKLPTHPTLVYFYLKFPILWKFFGKQFFVECKI